MVDDRDEPHFETNAARGASTPNIVRWILLISLFAVIVLLSIIWMTGAATHTGETEISVSEQMRDRADIQATDSIVGENANELDTVEPGEDPSVRTLENETQPERSAASEPETN